LKDQITHLPDNADRSVAKQKFKITNWSTYNKALINRGSLTFWLDDGAIQAWYESATPSSRGRPQRQKAAREAERGREAWTLGQGMKKPVAGCYGRLTRWKGGGDVVYMALL
jgi:hypothetical protein